jgi:hypothetical protein
VELNKKNASERPRTSPAVMDKIERAQLVALELAQSRAEKLRLRFDEKEARLRQILQDKTAVIEERRQQNNERYGYC